MVRCIHLNQLQNSVFEIAVPMRSHNQKNKNIIFLFFSIYLNHLMDSAIVNSNYPNYSFNILANVIIWVLSYYELFKQKFNINYKMKIQIKPLILQSV